MVSATRYDLTMSDPVARERRLSSLFWLAIVVVHAIAGLIWWWMMPAGFPLTHPRFLLHRVVPWILVAYALAMFVPRLRPLRPALLAAVPVDSKQLIAPAQHIENPSIAGDGDTSHSGRNIGNLLRQIVAVE